MNTKTKTKPVIYSLGFALLCAFVASTACAQNRVAPEVLPKPEQAFSDAKIGRTYKDSKPGTMAISKAPSGAPNVLIILIDDCGYGQWSTFGGQVPTPNLDRLAKMGLRYTRFHTTALCSPSRAAILTGRNHHSAGTGVITEMGDGYPGYSGQRTSANIAALLGSARYKTDSAPGRDSRLGFLVAGRTARGCAVDGGLRRLYRTDRL